MDFDEVDALNLYHWMRMKRFGPCKFISREGVVFYHTTGDIVLRVSNPSIDHRTMGIRLGDYPVVTPHPISDISNQLTDNDYVTPHPISDIHNHPIIEYNHSLLEDMLNHKFKFQEKKDQIF
jgi:hypothetical protein